MQTEPGRSSRRPEETTRLCSAAGENGALAFSSQIKPSWPAVLNMRSKLVGIANKTRNREETTKSAKKSHLSSDDVVEQDCLVLFNNNEHEPMLLSVGVWKELPVMYSIGHVGLDHG
jgi:hypothetical protein